MTWPSFTMKQLLTAVLLMCMGMGGMSFWWRSPDHNRFLPTAILVLGGVCVLMGVLFLAAKRRRGLFLTLALLGGILGSLAGDSLGSILSSLFRADTIQMHSRTQTLGTFLGMGIGAFTVLLFAAISECRKARSEEMPHEDVSQ